MPQCNDLRPTKTSIILSVKQQLDKRRLNSSVVNVQSAPILLKLLNLIIQLQDSLQNAKTLSPNLNYLKFSDLLRKYQTAISENNSLHLDIIYLKDQVCHLTAKLKDISNNLLEQKYQSKNLLSHSQKNSKETYLLDQLKNSIYKYNQLIDFLHENPDLQRQSIKRLLKHKHLNFQTLSPNNSPDYQSQNPILKPDNFIQDLQARLQIRNQEISRLHSKYSCYDKQILNYEGSNQHLLSKVRLLEEQIEKLTLQNISLKNNTRQYKKRDFKYGEFKSAKSLKSPPFFQKDIIRNPYNTFQQTTDNNSLSDMQAKLMEIKKDKYKLPNRQNNQPKKQIKSLYFQQFNSFQPQNQAVFIKTSKNSPQLENNKAYYKKILRSDQNLGASPYNHFHQKGHSRKKYPFIIQSKKDQQLKKYKSSQKHTDQQFSYFQKLLKQKDAKIQKLQSLLKVVKTQKVSKKTQKTQTNNVIINQQHNEYITFNKSQSQLQKAFCEPAKLFQKVIQLESRLHRYESNKKQKSSSNQNSSQILQEVRQRLFQVNKQNIDLQVELNQALETIKYLRNKLNNTQKSKDLNSNDFHLVFKQRDQFLTQIEALRKENQVLRKQLKQTQKQLELQREDMLDFQNNIKKNAES